MEDWIQPAKFEPTTYFFKHHNNKVEHKDTVNIFNVFVDNTLIQENNKEEIEENKNNYEEIKEKSIKTNKKVKKSKNSTKRKEKMHKKNKIEKCIFELTLITMKEDDGNKKIIIKVLQDSSDKRTSKKNKIK